MANRLDSNGTAGYAIVHHRRSTIFMYAFAAMEKPLLTFQGMPKPTYKGVDKD